MGNIKASSDVFVSSIPEGNGFALDIGCGSSPFKKDVVMRGYRYIGIDISSNNRADSVCDVHKLPFKDKHVPVNLLHACSGAFN